MLNEKILGTMSDFNCLAEKIDSENHINRIIAITHIHELAVKSPEIHYALLDFYKKTIEFANNNNISYSIITASNNDDRVL